jgi:hypothetical protein
MNYKYTDDLGRFLVALEFIKKNYVSSGMIYNAGISEPLILTLEQNSLPYHFHRNAEE